MAKKRFATLEFIISLICVLLMIGMGYYFLSLGVSGAIDFGKNEYLNKLIWFFGSITLISCKAFFLKLKSIKYKLAMFLISFISLYLGFTLTGGVTFDAGDISLGLNIKLIAQSAMIIAIIVIVVFIVISYWFSDTTGDFLKSLIKSVASIGIVAVIGIWVVPALL